MIAYDVFLKVSAIVGKHFSVPREVVTYNPTRSPVFMDMQYVLVALLANHYKIPVASVADLTKITTSAVYARLREHSRRLKDDTLYKETFNKIKNSSRNALPFSKYSRKGIIGKSPRY